MRLNILCLLLWNFCLFDLRIAFAQVKDSTDSTESVHRAHANLLALKQSMNSQYQEQQTYVETILLALLTRQHAFALGGPGGAKTKVASEVLKTLGKNIFSLQFSPATKQEQILGMFKGKKYLEEGIMETLTQQSLLQHPYAIMDEIDKANPEVLATALSVLHERKGMIGHQEVEGALQTALITSNMTLSEFMEKFRQSGDGPTADAILDRILLKVLVLNRLSSASKLSAIENEGPTTDQPISLDLQPLQNELSRIQVPIEVQQLSFFLWMNLAKNLQKRQDEEAGHCAYPYKVTNQFSTRGAMSLLEIIKASKLLEPLPAQLPIVLSPKDLIHGQRMMIMQGPGDLQRGKLLKKLRAGYGHDLRTLKLLDDLAFEREQFLQAFHEVIIVYEQELKAIHLLGWENILKMMTGKDVQVLNESEKVKLFSSLEDFREKLEAKRKAAAFTVESVAQDKVLRELEEIKTTWPTQFSPKLLVEKGTQEKKVEQPKVDEEKLEDILEREQTGTVDMGGVKFIKEFTHNINGKSGSVSHVVFDPKKSTFMTYAESNTPIIWDLNQAVQIKYLGSPEFISRSQREIGGTLSPDGRFVAYTYKVGKDDFFNFWDFKENRLIKQHLLPGRVRSVDGGLEHMNFSSNQKYLLLSFDKGYGKVVYPSLVFDVDAGDFISSFEDNSENKIKEFLSPSGQYGFTSYKDGRKVLWDTRTGKKIFSVEDPNDESNYQLLFQFSADEKKLVWVNKTKQVRTLEIPSGKVLESFDLNQAYERYSQWTAAPTPEIYSYETLAISPNGQYLATTRFYKKAGNLETVEIWDLHTGVLSKVLRGHQSSIGFAKFSPSGLYLFTAARIGVDAVKIWSVEDGKLVNNLENIRELHDIYFSKDEGHFITRESNNRLKLWQAKRRNTP